MIQENGLLERDAQLAELLAAFEHVQTGEGKLVIVTGEAGVGKSALVEHFARLVADRCDFQTGLCEDLLSQRPLGAFDSVLTALELGQSAQHMDSASINLLFPSIVQKITRLANPLVWIIEDVHWADQVSLDLIRYVARRIHRIPLMVILTVRPEELAIHGRRAALMGDMPQRSITHIDVPLLSRSAVEQLTQSTPNASKGIFEATGGNPYFIKAVLQADTKFVASTNAPHVVRDRILSKLSKLSSSARLTIEFLSIFKGEISARYLQGVNQSLIAEQGYLLCDPADIEDCLSINLLRRTNQGFCFSHGFTRSVIEASLPPMLGRHFHWLTLTVLDQDPLAAKAQLVHHSRSAQASDRIAQDAYAAAVEASMAKAFSEAASYYELAIEGMHNWDQGRQSRVYAGWAHTYSIAFGPTDTCIERLEQASEMWRQIGDLKKCGATLRSLSVIQMFKGNGHAAMINAREAIAILEGCPPSSTLGLAYSQMAFCSMAFSDRAATQFWAQQALSLGFSLGSKSVTAHAKVCLGSALHESDQPQGFALLQEGLTLSVSGNNIEAALIGYVNATEFSLRHYNLSKASQTLVDALEYTSDNGLLQAYFGGLNALAELIKGNLTQAVHLASEFAQDGISSITESILQWPLGLVLGLAKARLIGDPAATRCLETGFELSLKSGLPRYILPCGLALIETHWLANNKASAVAIFERCAEQIGLLECPWLNGALAVWAKRLNTGLGVNRRHAKFEPRCAMAKPFQLELEGQVALAAAEWSRLGAPFEQSLCLMQGNLADLEKAIRLMYSIGAEFGAQAARRAASAQGMQHVPRGSYHFSRSHPLGLTAKENAVLNCLLEGNSNAQIASTLNRSERTIEHHVSGILAKSGAKNRSDLLVRVLTGKLGQLKVRSLSKA